MNNQTVLVKDAGAGRVSMSQMLGLAKQEVEAIAVLGFQLYEQGKVSEAETIFNGLIVLDSHVYYGYAGLGAMALAEEKLEEAIRWLTRATELNPKDPTVHANLGEALLRHARFSDAAAELHTALTLDAEQKDPGTNRARAILNGMQIVIQQAQRAQAGEAN
jgi:tetratricopeptide (TPR) repeat protein